MATTKTKLTLVILREKPQRYCNLLFHVCYWNAKRHSLSSTFQDFKIRHCFRYYSRKLNAQKKDTSSSLRKGKSSHWFAPGRKMQRYYHSLEVLCFARCHFRAHYQTALGYTKACKKDQVLLPCPVDRHFAAFFFFYLT